MKDRCLWERILYKWNIAKLALRFPCAARRISAASQTCLTDVVQNDLFLLYQDTSKVVKQRGFCRQTAPCWQSPSGSYCLRPLWTCPIPGSNPPPWPVGMWCPVPRDPWDLQVCCNHPASSQVPEFHPCTQGTSNMPAGFPKEGKTWTWQHWKGLLNTFTFFLSRTLLNPEPEEQGSRLWANIPLAAALEIAWQCLGIMPMLRCTKEAKWQVFDFSSWTV